MYNTKKKVLICTKTALNDKNKNSVERYCCNLNETALNDKNKNSVERDCCNETCHCQDIACLVVTCLCLMRDTSAALAATHFQAQQVQRSM
jgi:hypothetical protein